MLLVISVFTRPGLIEKTNTSLGASSTASTSEKRCTAALLGGYAVFAFMLAGCVRRYAEPLATLTMRPPPRSIIPGANARQQR